MRRELRETGNFRMPRHVYGNRFTAVYGQSRTLPRDVYVRESHNATRPLLCTITRNTRAPPPPRRRPNTAGSCRTRSSDARHVTGVAGTLLHTSRAAYSKNIFRMKRAKTCVGGGGQAVRARITSGYEKPRKVQSIISIT